ncbi:MAG: PmoA family protein [Bryobacterales bacterium]
MRKSFFAGIVAFASITACSGGPAETETAVPETAAVSFEQGQGQIHVFIDGQPFTTFRYEEQWDKPFLYPLRTASGTIISRGYPIEPREGEEHDHDWHRGIWFGHGDVNGTDFWREMGRDKTGTIVMVSAPSFEQNGGQGKLTAQLGLQTAKKEIIGTILEEITFSKVEALRIIDTTITVRADKGQALRFGDTEDGGFGIRLADEFRQDRGAALINSDGLKDTENIWGKPAKWVDYSTTMGGREVGVAMFDHPSNLRHPTRWHARGYSLCAANPFALGDFTGDKSNDGSYTIDEGGTLTFRYRVVIHEGETTPAQIEQLYGQFAGQ